MDEVQDIREEKQLTALFAGALGPLADEGFSAAVVRRIRRRIWIRRAVLGGAVIVGALLAFPPAYELAVSAGDGLASLISHWAQVRLPIDHQTLGIGLVAVIIGPLLVSMLEE